MDYNARYYSPTLGRFISPDSIVPEPTSSQGWNRYRYTRNNPLRYTDPSGHCVFVGIDTLSCATVAWLAVGGAAAVGTTAYLATNPDQAGIAAGAVGDAAQAAKDLFLEGATEVYPLDTQPDASVYNPGPTLGGEFTGSLNLPGASQADLPAPDFGLDFPLPDMSGLMPNVFTAEDHHIISPLTKKYSFANHPAIKESGFDIKKDPDNIISLDNHRGRHTYNYHNRIQNALDEVYEAAGGTDRLEQTLRETLKGLRKRLQTGELDPYEK